MAGLVAADERCALVAEGVHELGGLAGLDEYREKKHIWHNTKPAPQYWFGEPATPAAPAGEDGR